MTAADWSANSIVVLALVVAVLAVVYARQQAHAALSQAMAGARQATAGENAAWLATVIRFDPPKPPGFPVTQLIFFYSEGPTLDAVVFEVIDPDNSPVAGFGVGRPEGFSRTVKQVRVGDKIELPVVHRMGTTAFVSGELRLRLECARLADRREVFMAICFTDPTNVIF